MKLNYLCTMLDDIANVPGKNAKIDLLQKYLQEDSFRGLVKYMLDPYITFGILDFPEVKYDLSDEDPASFTQLVNFLDALAHRELTGFDAKCAARTMAARGVGRDLMLRILNKDPKAGFGISSVNKAWPGLLPEFPYMRCSLPKDSKMGEFNWERGIYSQLKADGSFVNINHHEDGTITLISRQGTILPLREFGPLVEEIKEKLRHDTQTHGELLVRDLKDMGILPRQIGNGVLNSVAQGGTLEPHYRIECHVWDQVPLSEVKTKAKYRETYNVRFFQLKCQVPPHKPELALTLCTVPSRIVTSRKEAYEHYQEVVAQGLEGTILKHPDSIWRDGVNKHCVKLKLETDCDLKIIGFNKGKGKNADTFGSLVCQSECGSLEVNVSGFSDKDRLDFWTRREELVGTIATVKANSVMKPSTSGKLYSLFLPRLVEVRSDKSSADDLEQIVKQFESAISKSA